MDSIPPPMVTSDHPAITLRQDNEIASSPDEQNLFTVAPETSIGKPAIWLAILPIFNPCSASGKEQPIMISSTSFFSRFSVFSTAAVKIKDRRSSGLVSLNAPLFLLQPGVLIDVTIYASLMAISSLVSKRLTGL